MIPYGHQFIDQNDVDSVIDVLNSEWLTTGPYIEKFEKSLCEYTGSRYAVAVNSATSALDIAVQSLGLPRGSEIISTAFTFAATNNAILYNNNKPVFADIQPDTRNIDPDDIRRRITPKTRAIIAVDYAGHPCELDEICEIASDHDLFFIEDASHALGATYHQKKVGTFADITIFSFHPVKPITTGEGGAALSNNEDLTEKMRLLRNHGITKPENPEANPETAWQYDMKFLGRNYRLTDIQAALGLSQIKKLDHFIKKRNLIAQRYLTELQDMANIQLPSVRKNICHGWHLFTILTEGIERNRLFGYLKSNGVGVNVHYIPTYRFSYYRDNLPLNYSDYPVTENIFQRIITLPIYPKMDDEAIEYIINKMRSFPQKK